MKFRYIQVLANSAASAVLIVGFGLVACSSTTAAPDEQSSKPQERDYSELESGEHVLVYRDGEFRTTPDDSGGVFRAFKPHRQSAEALSEPRIVARVVTDHGEFVEVERPESGRDTPNFCDNARLNSKLDKVVLRYFVTRRDLAPTVRRRVTYDYDDDTGVELAPGLPVEPHPDDPDRFRIGDDLFRFTVDDDPEVGRSGFSPGGLSGDDKRYFRKDVDSHAEFHIGERTVKVDTDDEKIRVPRVDQRGDQRLVRLQGSCFRLTARIDRDDASAPIQPPPGTARGYGRGLLVTDLVATPGTEVYWPDGQPAGEVVEKKHFRSKDIDDDHRICETTELVGEPDEFSRGGLSPEPQRSVEYCVNVDDLEEVEWEE